MEIKGFNLSTDYILLWNLINRDHRIPAWLRYEGEIFDLVEVKRNAYGNVMISTRGIAYEEFEYKTMNDFIKHCSKLEIRFIAPLQLPDKEEIEKNAENYAESENSAYNNDFYGFINGARFIIERLTDENI